jgi:hypothetical protein
MTGTTPDPVTRWLESRLGGSEDDTLDELSQINPQLGLLARVLASRETGDAVDDERIASLRERTETLRRRFNEVIQEADDAVTRLGLLADALGACAACWGEDLECGWCHGRGRPGFAEPEPNFFDRLVLPAVRTAARLRQSGTSARHDEHDSSQEG